MIHTSPERGTDVPAAMWGEFVALPETTSALRAVRRLARSFANSRSSLAPPSPLLLHGPPGTGKTFLVQTMVRELIRHPDGITVQVIPARDVKEQTPDPAEFENGFADWVACDLLAIEDVQHLPVKSASALCRLLDRRASRRRPTVLTASTGPAGMSQFPRRLTNRLSAGLVIRLDPPSQASRRKLATRFAVQRNLRLADDALDWLASEADGVRALAGLVQRLASLAGKRARPMSRRTIVTLLQEQEPTAEKAPKTLPISKIVTRVAATYAVQVKDLLGTGRQRLIMLARQVAMYLARTVAKLSLPRIGTHFGGRDHTTVLHAVRKIEQAITTDAKLKRTVRELTKELG